MKKSWANIFWGLFVAAIFVVLIYDKVTSSAPSVNMYTLHINSQEAITKEIEREDLRREQYGEAPLSDDEIKDISERNVTNEYRKLAR